jgi:hypothetical protein
MEPEKLRRKIAQKKKKKMTAPNFEMKKSITQKKSITSFAADLILNHHDHTCAPWHCGSVRH